MQLFSCPFCGMRDETEFFYAGEAGKARPGMDANAEAWAGYLYFQTNPKGLSREIWVHRLCGEFFEMERNTLTHAVTGTRRLGSADG
jgi:sarcosine oxidase subunit delta